MKFYISSAFRNTREIVEIAKVADDLGYDGMGIPDHIVNLETLSTPYPYTKDGQRRWQPFTEWPDPWVLVGALAQVTTRLRFVGGKSHRHRGISRRRAGGGRYRCWLVCGRVRVDGAALLRPR
jgi:hypothetical protein